MLQHILHGKAAGELAAHRAILPEIRHRRQRIGFIAVPAALCDPSQPLHGVLFLAGHIVIKAEALFGREAERPAHQQFRRRKSGKVICGIFVPDRLVRHGHQAIFTFDVPLAPVTKAAQLHIGNKAVRAQKLRQCIKHTVMRCPEHRIGIVWRIAFSVIRIVPAAILCLRIKPVRDIQMCLLSRHIANKADHQMDPLLPQRGKAVFFADRLPRINALFRLCLPPCKFQIAKRCIASLCGIDHRCVTDLSIRKCAVIRSIGSCFCGRCDHCHSHPQQTEPCRQDL